VGLRAGLDWCGKSHPTGIRSPDRPAHRQSTEVKCLGLILDKGLTGTVQLKNVMNKTYRAFWTCKGTFGKT